MIDLSSWQTGLAAVYSDAKEFLSALRFARPWPAWLALWPVAYAVLIWVTRRVVQRHLARLGRPGAVAGLLTDRRGIGRLPRLAFALGWSALALGISGPRWGKGDDGGVAVGRDLIVVLDFSRSMLAEDLKDTRARWKAAADATNDILDTAAASGGHRLALVVFAARPLLVVPLTTDYDHLRARLADLSADLPPPEIRPDSDAAKSGTRIGAALALAVAVHDNRFPGAQDILLFSDGDDPANDREWATGVTAARAANIPVHVIGIGDPTQPSKVFRKEEPLEHKGEFVWTQLREDVLTAIAGEGQGVYTAARRESPAVSDLLVKLSGHPRTLTDDATPLPKDRSVWFFAAAFVFLVCWLWKEK